MDVFKFSILLFVLTYGHGCVLPSFPKNGNWSVFGGLKKNPKQVVLEDTILLVKCNTGYKLYPDKHSSVCLSGGNWEEIPKCIKTCSSIESSLSPTCILKGTITSCQNPYEGTVANLKCPPFYENTYLSRNPYRLCINGSWNKPLPECEPICGLGSQETDNLQNGLESVVKGNFPWHVGVYLADRIEQICGASIITPKISISAAHCFRFDDTNKYLLAGGKYYRKYKHSEDKYAQYSKVEKIIKHKNYNNLNNGANDIAILVLEKPFKMSPWVLPVCLHLGDNFEYSLLENKIGVFVGWGSVNELDGPSETLKVVAVKYKSEDKCVLKPNMRHYYKPFVQDKVCAESTQQGKNFCPGDSGGGLMFYGDNDRYFIRGIASVSPRGIGGRYDVPVALYTGISYHKNMLFQKMAKYLV